LQVIQVNVQFLLLLLAALVHRGIDRLLEGSFALLFLLSGLKLLLLELGLLAAPLTF
jgi:hypothetical protein